MLFAVIISRNQSWLLAPAECKLQPNVPHSLLTQPLGRLHVASTVSTCDNNNLNQGGCVLTRVHLFVNSHYAKNYYHKSCRNTVSIREEPVTFWCRTGSEAESREKKVHFFNFVRLVDFSGNNSWLLMEKRWKRFMTECHLVQIQVKVLGWRYALDWVSF